MTDLRKAAEMALECLNYHWDYFEDESGDGLYVLEAKKALRQALAQPVDAVNISQERVDETAKDRHEPVAWIHDGGKGELWWYRSSKFDEEGNLIGDNPDDVPLYTAPPKREWVGLTEDDYDELLKGDWGGSLIQRVEAKLKEKNT